MDEWSKGRSSTPDFESSWKAAESLSIESKEFLDKQIEHVIWLLEWKGRWGIDKKIITHFTYLEFFQNENSSFNRLLSKLALFEKI